MPKDYDKSCLVIVLKCKLHFWKSLIQAFRVYVKFAKKSKPFEWIEQNSDMQGASRGKVYDKMYYLLPPMTVIYYP